MNKHESVCYKKPFLKEVILRLDFGAPVESFSKTLPQKLAKAALQRFPISEPQTAQVQSINFSGSGVHSKTEETNEWVYHGKDREKTLTITSETLIVRCKRYDAYDKFKDDVDHILKAVYEANRDISVSRVGLRYINIVDAPDDDPLSWSKYINEEMLGIIDMHKSGRPLTRAFHIIEFNFDGQNVRFQFGIANPDYPAPIKRRQFVLDIDSYFMGALSQDDVQRGIGLSHEKIQELFEESITDETRRLMKPVASDEQQ